MSGWEQLIRAAAEKAGPVEWLRSLDSGSLVLTPVDSRGLDPQRVRGTVGAARALSREICDACGGPGDPVWPAGGRGGTRCAGCCGAGDEVLPRDWMETHRGSCARCAGAGCRNGGNVHGQQCSSRSWAAAASRPWFCSGCG